MTSRLRSSLAFVLALTLARSGEGGETARAGTGHSARETVIFVVIDTLRADHLGVHGYVRDTTPTLDRLARAGLHLPYVVVQATQTAPSVASILTSTLPSQHGIQYEGRTGQFLGKGGLSGAPVLSESAVTLAEWLGRRGFRTAAVVANPWLRADLGFAQGFGRFEQIDCHDSLARRAHRERREARESPERSPSVCDGARINALAETILREDGDQPLFLYLHYMDVHNPYGHGGLLPARWRVAPGRDVFVRSGRAPLVPAADLRYTVALYDEGIAYTDGLLERLLRFLDETELLGRTTLLVTTDHGEEFLEHGGLGHGTSLHHELLQSFAVIWNPRRVAARRIDERVAAVDLMPTLLGLLGLESPSEIAGRDVRAPVAGGARYIVAELANQKALLRGEWKMVLHLEPPQSALSRVDLSGAPLGPAGPKAERTAAAMRTVLEELARRASSAPVEGLDEESVRALRALGYLN
jgi:arylsulfatase A-like enzyme